MKGLNLVPNVSTKDVYYRTPDYPEFRVTVIDYGVKLNTIRCLNAINADVTVVPHDFSVLDILKTDPDGILLSNGPGDPATMAEEIDSLKELLGKKPVFGICLGHQLLSRALGFETYKLKFGHHGINQPVKNLKTGKVEITSQNHGFCVDMANTGGESISGTLTTIPWRALKTMGLRLFPFNTTPKVRRAQGIPGTFSKSSRIYVCPAENEARRHAVVSVRR